MKPHIGSEQKNFDQVVKQTLESVLSPKTRFLDGEVQPYWKRVFDVILTSLPMCGFIVHLVEHRTVMVEVTGEALIFSSLVFPIA